MMNDLIQFSKRGLFILVLLLSMTACGGSNEAEESSTTDTAVDAIPTSSPGGPQPTIVSGIGDITAVVEEYRQLLGGVNNGGDPGSKGTTGYREINWDSVPDEMAAPNPYPSDFFNAPEAPRARGIFLQTPGTALMISANSDNPFGVLPRFGNINPQYADIFKTFSEERLFSPVGSHVVNLTFFVPGTNIPATVRGFGAVYTDVDTNHTAFEYFDVNGQSLGKFETPIADNGLSFLGVAFDEPIVYRVEVRYGTGALGPNDGEGGVDVAVMDNFIYGEPQPVAGAETAQTTTDPATIPVPDVTLPAKFVTANEQRLSSLEVDLTTLSPAPDGLTYVVWLGNAQGDWEMGGAAAGGQLFTYVDPSGRNLLERVTGVSLSLEESAAATAMTAPNHIWYTASIPAHIQSDIRLLVVSAPDTPSNMPYDPGLKAQAEVALAHAQLALDAFNAGDLPGGQNHIEHVWNILLGSANPEYGDMNGDGSAQNPGDGFGIEPYAVKAAEVVDRIAETPDLSEFHRQAAVNLGVCVRNVSSTWVPEAKALAGQIMTATDVTAAQAAAQVLVISLNNLLNGLDIDANGTIDANPNECGAERAYQFSHDLFDLVLVRP